MCSHRARFGRQAAAVTGALTMLTAAALLLVPTPAEAATTGRISRIGNLLSFTATDAVINDNVSVFVDASGRIAIGDNQPMTAGVGCTVASDGFGSVGRCGFGITSVQVFGLAGNDSFTVEASLPTLVGGGSGNDTLRSGVAKGGPSQVNFDGGDGTDLVDYGLARRGVTVNLASAANDGRPGDLDNIQKTVENIKGTGFPDRVTGSEFNNLIDGSLGSDVVNGGDGNDIFAEGNRTNGSDDIVGGEGVDTVVYSLRTGDVTVGLDGLRNDGQAGELDLVSADVDNIVTGSGDDTLTGNAGTNKLTSSAGDDKLDGLGGDDVLSADEGNDLVLGGPGNDFIQARDSAADEVRCATGTDRVQIDAGLDTVTDCETVN